MVILNYKLGGYTKKPLSWEGVLWKALKVPT